ncbi:MAG: hypothetical protein F6K24_11585 [Okeania sp. SIO2D1]|nr:hypothetical protein [Okeania sp. SIO2D1]
MGIPRCLVEQRREDVKSQNKILSMEPLNVGNVITASYLAYEEGARF